MLTNETISLWQVLFLALTSVLCIGLPVAAAVYWRKTHHARLFPLLVGALIFVVFARVLEAGLHYFCIIADNPVSRAINASTWLYAIYGALAAGIFEEMGRYFAFRTLLRKYPERDTAVTYGIGHGGIESILLLGVNFALLAVIAQFARSGNMPAILSLVKGDSAQAQQLLSQIGGFTPGTCVLTVIERVFALLMQIALSIFVFVAARDKTQRSYLPFAIALHAIADIPAAMYQRGVLPMFVVELFFAVFSLYALRSARKCYLEMTDP